MRRYFETNRYWAHKCPECTFLGSWEDKDLPAENRHEYNDLYFCLGPDNTPRIVYKWGDSHWQQVEGWPGIGTGSDDPIMVGYHLACAMGLYNPATPRDDSDPESWYRVFWKDGEWHTGSTWAVYKGQQGLRDAINHCAEVIYPAVVRRVNSMDSKEGPVVYGNIPYSEQCEE